MKFTIHKSDFRQVLSKVQGITGRKTNLAITETVLIRANADGIRLTASDHQTGMEGAYPADVESEGEIAINARKLFEIVRDFPSDDVVLDEEENRWIRIGNDTIEYHIVGLNPEDFSGIPDIEDVEMFEVDADGIRRMIEKTVIIGAPADEKRPHIIGVYFEKVAPDNADEQARMRMVSTDGNRLSMTDSPLSGEDRMPEKGVLIPKKGLQEVLRFLDAEGTLELGVGTSHLVIRKAEETIAIRLLDGDFPQYQEIVRHDHGVNARINRKLFLMVLRRMSILSSDNYTGVIFNIEPNLLRITATNPEIGESKEEMAIEYDGDTMEMAFNPKFYIEFLNAIEDESVLLHLLDPERPCVLTGENDTAFLSVIMPMRI